MTVDAYDVYGSYRAMRTRALAKAFFKGTLRGPDAAAAAGEVGRDGTAYTGGQQQVQADTEDKQQERVGMEYGTDGTTYMPPERLQAGDGAGPGVCTA